MKKRFKLLIPIVAALGLVVAGCSNNNSDKASNDKQVTIRYAHFQPGTLDQPKQAAAEAFKSYVESKTNGSVKVELYPAGQLGNEETLLEGLKLGSIQMGVIHDGPVTSMYKPLSVFNLPYLFQSQGEAWTVYDSDFTKKLGDDMVKKNQIRLLALADNGVRHFTNNKKPIKSPQDLSGMKMRVQPGELYTQLVKETGANPSSIPWNELPTALQQNVVDGQENGVTNILAASLYQSQKHVTLDGHIYSFHAYLISEKFYSTLSDNQKKVVNEGVELAKWIHRSMTANQDMNAESILREKGMTVTKLTDTEKEAFSKVVQPPIIEWMKKEIGNEWVNGILNEVNALRK
jgi:tripartite ATP-independent transporter DctP family solute receptor